MQPGPFESTPPDGSPKGSGAPAIGGMALTAIVARFGAAWVLAGPCPGSEQTRPTPGSGQTMPTRTSNNAHNNANQRRPGGSTRRGFRRRQFHAHVRNRKPKGTRGTLVCRNYLACFSSHTKLHATRTKLAKRSFLTSYSKRGTRYWKPWDFYRGGLYVVHSRQHGLGFVLGNSHHYDRQDF